MIVRAGALAASIVGAKGSDSVLASTEAPF